jgi:ribonuclease P protein component
MRATLRPQERLHDNRDYGRVFKRPIKLGGRNLSVMLSPSRPDKPARLGVVVSTKVSKLAVRRHQLKRWVRELFRLRLKHELRGYDVVVLFRSAPDSYTHAMLDEEVTTLLARFKPRESPTP